MLLISFDWFILILRCYWISDLMVSLSKVHHRCWTSQLLSLVDLCCLWGIGVPIVSHLSSFLMSSPIYGKVWNLIEASRSEHLTPFILFEQLEEVKDGLIVPSCVSTCVRYWASFMILSWYILYRPSDWQIPTAVGASIHSAVSVSQEFVPKSEGESQCTGTVASWKWRLTPRGHGTLGCGGVC